jgi:hypothetical protein
LFLVAQDFVHCQAARVDITETPASLDVQLRPALRLRGRVTDPNGRVIPRAEVGLSSWDYRQPSVTGVNPPVMTDDRGEYEIRAVPGQKEGLKFSLFVHADGYGPVEVRQTVLSDTPEVPVSLDPVILQQADQAVSGMAVDANSRPIPGLEIFVNGPGGNSWAGQPDRYVITDGQGRFVVEGLCKGQLDIGAGSGKRTREGYLDARGGDRDLRVVVGVDTGLIGHGPPMRQQPPRRLVYRSLKDTALPDLKDLCAGCEGTGTDGRGVLLCFVDMEQRPCRQCLRDVATRAGSLDAKGIRVVVVETSKADPNQYAGWLKANQITFPIHVFEGDVEAKKAAWGVKVLPWLILTDQEHKVVAEGLAIGELNAVLDKAR